VENVTAGIADALTVGKDGRPVVVVDWKSDVNPETQLLEHYRAQVRAYLDMTGAERGLVVLMTKGTVIAVLPSPQTVAA
jgi:exodeoxyribonuclease-5